MRLVWTPGLTSLLLKLALDGRRVMTMTQKWGRLSMVHTVPGLTDDLANAGFSIRTINALIEGLQLKAIEDLEAWDWIAPNEPGGLVWHARALPNLGPVGVAEVEAFLKTGDARNAKPSGPIGVAMRMDHAELEALDAWAKSHKLTRSQAAKVLVAEGLARSTLKNC